MAVQGCICAISSLVQDSKLHFVETLRFPEVCCDCPTDNTPEKNEMNTSTRIGKKLNIFWCSGLSQFDLGTFGSKCWFAANVDYNIWQRPLMLVPARLSGETFLLSDQHLCLQDRLPIQISCRDAMKILSKSTHGHKEQGLAQNP